MPSPVNPDMPLVWEDADAWDAYYANLPQARRHEIARHFGFDRLVSLVTATVERSVPRIWVPGCGCSVLARLLSLSGAVAHATDISSAAIDFQLSAESHAIAENIFELLQRRSPPTVEHPPCGEFIAEVHNCRETYHRNEFNIVMNVLAIQGFTVANQRIIARTHFEALRPQGTAYFEVKNVQAERCDHLESALADAGFLVPSLESNRWFRKTLRDTGIPHIFILGRPVIQPAPAHRQDPTLLARDRAILRQPEPEFQVRQRKEHELAKKRAEDPEVRFAQLIYGTG